MVAFHVRHRDRELEPDDRQRAHARRRDGEVRALRALAHRFRPLQELGIRFLRYGPPIHTTFLGEGRYDWEFADATFEYLRLRDVIPIVDLCHFGVPDWIGNFQNPDFPKTVRGVCARLRGPVPVGAALHPGQRDVHLRPVLGRLWLVERAAHHRPRVCDGLKHIVQANQRAMARSGVRADAIFIQSEKLRVFHAENPRSIKPAEIMNARRFLSLDLNYGRRVASEMYEYMHGQRHDPGGVPRLSGKLAAAPPLHHGQRLLRHQRSTG
jgi:hypothetical protein